MNSGLNPDLVKTGLDEVFFGGYDVEQDVGYASASNSLLYRPGSASNSAVISNIMGMPGKFTTVNEEEEPDHAQIRSDHKVTKSIENFKRTIPISKEFFDDEEHSAVTEEIEKLGMRAKSSQDENAAIKYADGFTTQTTNAGTALFSNSHTTLSGDTVDNLETGTLSYANLITLQTSLSDQLAQDGEIGGHMPAWLLVPTALRADAIEITQSELRAGTGNNNLNYFSKIFPGMQVFFSPFLGASFGGVDGGSDTAYFMGGRMHSMKRYVREGLYTRLIPWDLDDLDRYKYKAGYREVVFAKSFEGLVASNGTV